MEPVAQAKALDRRLFSLRFPHEVDCMICLDGLKGQKTTVYPCGHALHHRCERRYKSSVCKTNHLCPQCRRRVRVEASSSSSRPLLIWPRDETFDVLEEGFESLRASLDMMLAMDDVEHSFSV